MEQEQVLSKQLVQLENQFSHDSKEQEEVSGENEVIEDVETPQPTPRRSIRERKPPKRYTDFVSSVALFTDDGEPSCFQEAIDCAKNAKWKMAMKEEMDSLEKNETWNLVELPKDRKVVGCKWVFKLKKSVDNKIERYKARLVTKGYSQMEGIDYHEIFSPVVKLISIHMLHNRNKNVNCPLRYILPSSIYKNNFVSIL